MLLGLVGCSNLTAQLLPGERELPYTASYALAGQQHSFHAVFIVKDRRVMQFKIESQAATGQERGFQLAFFANVRRFVLEKVVMDIAIPDVVGDASPELVAAFRAVIEKLKVDA